MQHRELQQKVNHLHTFTLQDLENLFQKVDRSQLSRWESRGWLIRISDGLYALDTKRLDVHLLANEITPSYISLEYALSYYQMIPEIVRVVTSITAGSSREEKTPVGMFLYQKVKPELVTGYVLKKSTFNDVAFKIATPEKAMFDLAYVRQDLGDETDYESMRFNIPEGFDLSLIHI